MSVVGWKSRRKKLVGRLGTLENLLGGSLEHTVSKSGYVPRATTARTGGSEVAITAIIFGIERKVIF